MPGTVPWLLVVQFISCIGQGYHIYLLVIFTQSSYQQWLDHEVDPYMYIPCLQGY